MTGVEPSFNRAGKASMIFPLDVIAPWPGMKAQPGITFAFPSREQMGRHSVGESECDEVNCAGLLPVRETILRVPNITIRIEEAQLAHSGET